MSGQVVISSVGFVHPAGVGSTRVDLEFSSIPNPEKFFMAGGKYLHHYSLPDFSSSPFYPNKKKRRSMRNDAVFAYIAASLAIESGEIGDIPFENTSLYCGAGQCYGDMWPYIKQGIDASLQNGRFDLTQFGEKGHSRMYPFFSIRSLPALPMALIAEKFGIRGENAVYSSFGAESTIALQQGIQDIKSGKTNFALVGGFDYLSEPHKIDHLYFNDFYKGDFFGASSACFILLEELSHCCRRGHRYLGEILDAQCGHPPVNDGNDIDYTSQPFQNFCSFRNYGDTKRDGCGGVGKTKEGSNSQSASRGFWADAVYVNSSGTMETSKAEEAGAMKCFGNSNCNNSFQTYGSLLAGSEPFGTALLALTLGDKTGVSLCRSVFGAESVVFVKGAG